MKIDTYVKIVSRISRNLYGDKDLNPSLDQLVTGSQQTINIMGELNNSLKCDQLYRYIILLPFYLCNLIVKNLEPFYAVECASYFCRKPTIESNQFSKVKTLSILDQTSHLKLGLHYYSPFKYLKLWLFDLRDLDQGKVYG